MAASFPASIVVLATNVDNVDINYAADVNALQDEVIAIENTFGVNPHQSTARATNYASVDARLESLEGAVSYAGHTHVHASLTGLSADDHPQYILKTTGAGKGYLIAFTAAGTPVGLAPSVVNGQALIVDSTQAAGLKFGDVAPAYYRGFMNMGA